MPVGRAAVARGFVLDLVVPDLEVGMAGELADPPHDSRVVNQPLPSGRSFPDIDDLPHGMLADAAPAS